MLQSILNGCVVCQCQPLLNGCLSVLCFPLFLRKPALIIAELIQILLQHLLLGLLLPQGRRLVQIRSMGQLQRMQITLVLRCRSRCIFEALQTVVKIQLFGQLGCLRSILLQRLNQSMYRLIHLSLQFLLHRKHFFGFLTVSLRIPQDPFLRKTGIFCFQQ